ncbi:MAG TPA: carbon-nitrogen hydrolase [Gammaproteobacteria bacterium]|nr:carbon-nitrogen hydrolase [Gammaproteobacteria bacterium]
MSKNRHLSLALIQHPCGADRADNIATSEAAIHEAARQGAELILLQELHTGLYFCQQESTDNFDLAETIPGPTTEYFACLAAELNVVIVVSLFEHRGAGVYHNTAVVLDKQQGRVGQYRKMHIPNDPGFHEKYYFTPGDHTQGFEPIDTSVGRLGVLVCWDQWFPEAARLMALAGAELLLYPTAIGWDNCDDATEQARQRDAWITVQRGHAIANSIPLAACNRIGFEAAPSGQGHGIHFWGSSFVAGPQGEMLAQGPQDAADIILAKLNMTRTEQVRRVWPYLRDRRTDAYEDLLKRYRD